MKAIVIEKFGGPEVLTLNEIEKPTPRDKEILVKIHATTVNFGDLTARDFKHVYPKRFHMPFLFWVMSFPVFGFRRPKKKILGNEFSGVVEEIGKDVKSFKIGDEVYGYSGMNMGSYAEYICMEEESIVAIKPSNMSFEEAATLPYGGIVGQNIYKKFTIKEGDKILVNGASGGIGSALLQLAKSSGAKVTGVCGTLNINYVKTLGADNVIDYKKEDFTKMGDTYDFVFDILGKSSFSKCKPSLSQNGRYILTSFKGKHLFQMIWTKLFGKKKVICAISGESKEDLIDYKKLVEEGKIKTKIDKTFTLEQAREAHQYIEDGLKKGNVVLVVK